jgi:hypothetical protein
MNSDIGTVAESKKAATTNQPKHFFRLMVWLADSAREHESLLRRDDKGHW